MNGKKTKSITLVKIEVPTETRSMTVEPDSTKNSSSRSTGFRCTDWQEDEVDDSRIQGRITNGGFENNPSSTTKSRKQVDRAPVGNHKCGKNEVADFRTRQKGNREFQRLHLKKQYKTHIDCLLS